MTPDTVNAHSSTRLMAAKVVLVANTAWYIQNFRRGLIRQLADQGYAVTAIAPPDDYVPALRALGANFCALAIDSKGTNPVADLRLTLALRGILRAERPACVLTFTVKPNVYGAFAAASLGIPVISNVSGLGTTFTRRNWVTSIVRLLYRGALRRASTVFFQNPDDMRLFVQGRLIDSSKARLLPGSGVDIHRFAPTIRSNERNKKFRFLLLGRLLWDKGVGEFVEAAARVKRAFSDCEFVLMGFTGIDNPTAIPMSKIEEWERGGLVTYVAPATDVREQLSQAHCVVLPSYYREGTPRSLLEASSMAIPIITTDAPGCRQVVEDGVTGYLVSVRNADHLAERMVRMMQLPESERAAMGMRGREKMVKEFDERIVIEEYLQAIRECTSMA